MGRKSQVISFSEWIERTGVIEVAKLLDVDPSTVRHWRLCNSYPRTDQMRIIKKKTKGLIGYDQIIDGKPTIERTARA